MENLTALQEKFNDIFRYQIENNGRKSKITRSEFWDDIYFHRDNDTSTFDIFINSDCPVLFVTGMVGTGKSTFVRSIYEKARLCTGIIIDFKGHSDKFQIDEEDVIENTIKIILEESLLNLIRENIKYRLIKNIPSFIDLHYDPKFIIENIDPSDWNSPYWEFMTNQEVFLLAMSNLHSFTEISNFAYENGLMPGKDHKDFLETCRKKIEANSNLLSNLLKLLDWKKLLELLRIISDRQEVFVLCFDNIDAIKFSKIQEHFLEALINVSNIANNSKANGNITALNSTPIKIVLNVRDENISRLNLSAAGTKRHMQIMLNEDCKVLDIASEKKYLTKSKEFFFEIINRRLDKIILNYNNSEEFSAIIKLIKSQILDIENKNLRQGDLFYGNHQYLCCLN